MRASIASSQAGMVVDFYICRRCSSCFVSGEVDGSTDDEVDGSTDDEVDGSTDDDGENGSTEGEADDLMNGESVMVFDG